MNKTMTEKITSAISNKVNSVTNIDGFIAKRQEFIEKVNAIMVEGKDYHVIQNKKSLGKGGAEKIASIFGWSATFLMDSEAITMLGEETKGLVAFKCTLNKGKKFVGEGRGVALLAKNAGDPNKTVKMAQKSAYIDAVIRASGMSDFFTQDLEDMPISEVSTTTVKNEKREFVKSNVVREESKKSLATEKQVGLIFVLAKQKLGVTSKEDVMPSICTAMVIPEFEMKKLDKTMASEINEFLMNKKPGETLPVIEAEESSAKQESYPETDDTINPEDIPF
jgi:hypothetical protein